LFYLYNSGNIALFLAIFAAAAFTDLIDGFLAGRLKGTTKFGAYYDAATDFAFVIGIFTFFSLKGFYPV
jgi:phosphatidylglycerophosphate synthase